MLFFFELFLFVLVMLTLALGEFVSRGLALGLWMAMTVLCLAGYLLARQSLQARAESEATDQPRSTETTAAPGAEAALDERWARTLLYNWRRTNVLLLVGVVAVGCWYWLGRG
jgi:hypothetical protein